MRTSIVALAIGAMAAGPLAAKDISCRNEAAEVSCADGECTIETEAFTPMELSIEEDGTASLCAYSICMNGTTVVRMDRESWSMFDLALPGPEQAGSEKSTRVAVIVNRETSTAQMSWGHYAQLMTCRAGDDLLS